MKVAGQESRLSKHVLSCSRSWSLGEELGHRGTHRNSHVARRNSNHLLQFFRHPLNSQHGEHGRLLLLCGSRVT